MNGLVVIDKPSDMTSRDAVNCLARTLGKGVKMGHTGTLDPLATGVLVVCLGHATRCADAVQAMPKTYLAQIRLGATSTTDDADGEITDHSPSDEISLARLEEILQQFHGDIVQQPPAYSAIKVQGKRAYDIARSGQHVELKPRTVHIYELQLLKYEWPYIELQITVSKGTYIRSLARDIGALLGVGGYITILRRTAVGPFVVEQGIHPTAERRLIASRLYPMQAAFPDVTMKVISGEDRIRINRGLSISGAEQGRIGLVAPSGDLAALAEGDGVTLKPVMVFPGA